MQLTSPFFLFLFFPLSLPLVLLLPKTVRRLSLSLISILWYVLANVQNPQGLVHVALLIFFATVLAYLPLPQRISVAKIRTVLGVTLPLCSFLTARILGEYFPRLYAYPIGLFFITLSIISYFIDIARGDVISPKNPLELIGYFLFFPTLCMGPVLRSKHFFDLTENISFQPQRFTNGIRFYMIGYIKRMAVAAVFLRAMEDILTFSAVLLHPLSYLFLLIFSFLCFYFYLTGSADLARGLAAMYGFELPRDRGLVPFSVAPHRVLYGSFLSFYNYLLDYIYQPLRRRFRGKACRPLGSCLLFALTVLAWRTRPETLLLALPVLLFSLLALCPAVRQKVHIRHWLMRILLTLISGLLCSFFTLGLLTEDPLDALRLAGAAFGNTAPYQPHYIFGMIRDGRYLIILSVLLLLLLPYLYMRHALRKKCSERTEKTLLISETVLVFALFVLTIVFFMPQFPQYATNGMFYM
ncbi:MAG: hypothetical protein E7585_06165 [Ruminococcaceae bacterium]|nr:hypothetical protein [Oscillospiraceae bacterium]